MGQRDGCPSAAGGPPDRARVGGVLGQRTREAQTLSQSSLAACGVGPQGSRPGWVVPTVLPQFGGLGWKERRVG